jgi:hypothetical protein
MWPRKGRPDAAPSGWRHHVWALLGARAALRQDETIAVFGGARRVNLGALAAISVGITLICGHAWGAFEFSKASWDSSTELLKLARSKLGSERVVLGANLDWSRLRPADGVLILHPDTRLQFAEVSAFLSQGGRLAVLDDFGKSEPLLNRFRIQRVSAPAEPLETLQNNPHLQLARPAVSYGAGAAGLTHPMLEGVDHVVTNHPTALTTDPDVELTPILSLADRQGKEHLLAVIGVIGDVAACGLDDAPRARVRTQCGRLFAMGDPSVFIDLMMTFEGNRALASGLIDYLLQDDGWGARQGKLYVLTNDFGQSGHFGGDETLKERLLEALDTAADLLASTRKNGLPESAAWGLALGLCGLLGYAALRASGNVYQRPRPRYAQSPALVAQGGVIGKAAVLSRTTTSDALVVLELKTAIETWLREHLRLPADTAQQVLLQELKQRQLLDAAIYLRLERTLTQMREVETALLSPSGLPPGAPSPRQMHAILVSTLEQLRGQPNPTQS